MGQGIFPTIATLRGWRYQEVGGLPRQTGAVSHGRDSSWGPGTAISRAGTLRNNIAGAEEEWRDVPEWEGWD